MQVDFDLTETLSPQGTSHFTCMSNEQKMCHWKLYIVAHEADCWGESCQEKFNDYLHWISVHDVKVSAKFLFDDLAQLLFVLRAEVIQVANLQKYTLSKPHQKIVDLGPISQRIHQKFNSKSLAALIFEIHTFYQF